MIHACSFNGGNAPDIGFHSVMDNPDSVSLVIPPIRIWIMIIRTPNNNQRLTCWLFLLLSFIAAKVNDYNVDKCCAINKND